MTVYADIYRYRELFVSLFRRDLHVRYRGSALGLLWTFINPLALVGIYALFVVNGLAAWTFLSTSLTTASASLTGQAFLVKQVRFPRQLLPLSVTATGIVTLVAILAIVLPLNLVFVPTPGRLSGRGC